MINRTTELLPASPLRPRNLQHREVGRICGSRGVEQCNSAAEGVDFTVSGEICQDPIGSVEHNACVAAGYTARDSV